MAAVSSLYGAEILIGVIVLDCRIVVGSDWEVCTFWIHKMEQIHVHNKCI